ncbi:MAG: hypothetical protein COA79_09405 [Planctomycetota bacterium]|nr:MAG: hypothetical protein COA79_09405 [Planctomycetota bacterium]
MTKNYENNPIIPNTDWKVHDQIRAQPEIVVPGSLCELPSVTPPSDATVLFDGSNTEEWVHVNDDRPCEWEIIDDNIMRVVPKTKNIKTKKSFGDCQLHVEWSAPTEIKGEGQGRGNSGIFMMGDYEIQVLDDYSNPTYADGLSCALYGQKPPLVNSSCKPGQWHIYDIIWKAPIFTDDELTSPAYVTVIHNGVVVQNNYKLIGRTTHMDLGTYAPHPAKGPIWLQDHGDLVSFRNIWIRDL